MMKVQSPRVRVNHISRWFVPSLCGVLAQSVAFGRTTANYPPYTRCVVPDKTAFNGGDDCAPRAENSNAARTINVQKDTGPDVGDVVVVSIPQRNCRTQLNQLSGGMSLVVDNSDSMKDTDPDNERLGPSEEFLRSVNSNSSSVTVPTSSADYPRVGVVSYDGRPALEDGYESDGINIKKTVSYCSDGDAFSAGDLFPNEGSLNRWTEKKDGRLLSVCEWLRPVTADTLGNASSSTGSLARHIDFLYYAGKMPRGLTDLSYFYHAIKQPTMLGNLSTRSKNAIVITDGLPNITKFVREADCKKVSYLQGEDIIQVQDVSGKLVNVCRDRQPRAAAKTAYDYIEAQPDYAGINVYNVLFVAKGNAFEDRDDQGIINPADVLIEASARTGNGKVKFKYARSKADLNTYLLGMTTNFDAASLQRVEVQVGSNPKYNAVSPSGFNKDYTVKFIGLTNGSNTVRVTAFYGDSNYTHTYTVNVGNSTDSNIACASADTNKTVDGDPFDEKNPIGDGVKPLPKPDNSQDRVYRNSDSENGKYTNRDFNQSANPIAPKSSTPQPQDLRIQGGTGNCGVVAGVASGIVAKGGSGPSAEQLFFQWLSLLAGLPLCAFLFKRSGFRFFQGKEKE